MRIGLIINCMGQSKENYQKTQNLFWDIRPKVKNSELEVIFPDKDWFDSWEKPPHEEFPETIDVSTINEKRGNNNKGQVVCMCVCGFIKNNCDAIIHIDGSGSFDLNKIIDLVQELQNSNNEAIFTIRSVSAIDEFRELIEKFEIALVNGIYSELIPDGQSGCWAFRILQDDIKPNGKGMKLTAKGYEIELDVLTEILRLKRRKIWIPIEVNADRTSSQFAKTKIGGNMDYHALKLHFLCKKLGIKKNDISSKFLLFKDDHKEKVNQYRALFEEYENKMKELEF